ncbi:MAG: hypothetical protein HY647_08390 [Acidobacteria bacterium]|nr:hypothetical protein [Acidobacteriota bacterium]
MNPLLSQQSVEAAEREAELRLAEFQQLRARSALCASATEQLATEAAANFLTHFRDHGAYLADAITLLAEIATMEEPCLAEPGQHATFPLLVEQLSDSFNPAYCQLYDRVFAQMISYCRRLPLGRELDAALRRFGLESEADLLERKSRMRQRQPLHDAFQRNPVRKVMVLSRVTLGADVAITSLVLQKVKSSFPQAERVLMGLPKVRELFGGDESLRFRQIQYANDSSLLERLQNWLPVVQAVEEEVRGLSSQEYVLLDPDSRLLQLGLLPALPEESRYFFFESRRFGELGTGSIGQITLRWLQGLFGGEEALFPGVWLREEDRNWGRRICQQLRQSGTNYLVAISFGVGGNPLKRLSDAFEEHLVDHLLAEGCTVILDKGFGEEEIGRANRLVARARAGGRQVIELDETHRETMRSGELDRCQMLIWQGGIGPFSALISHSDEYIGYDSAGQHIAAALGVPLVDIFTASTMPVFRERWRPFGSSIVKVAVESGEPENTVPMVAHAMILHSEIRSRTPRTKQ